MNRPVYILSFLLLYAPASMAGFTDTAPSSTFILDESISISTLKYRYDDNGKRTTLIDPIERYEPGSGLQGILIPEAQVGFLVLVNMIQYGLFDDLSLAIGIPVVLSTDIDLNLKWTPGDYQNTLGRSYSEDDFWAWANSMGQPKPTDWHGSKGVLSDIILGLRYRFSDDIPWFAGTGVKMSLQVMGALPTSTQADPEEVASAGTTMWDLHSMGEFGAHLSLEKDFGGPLQGRLSLGLDVFYEALFEHEYVTPKGTKNPLLLSYSSYVGDTYTLDPGDFSGLAVELRVIPLYGPALATWLVKGDAGAADRLPPMLSVVFRYTYTHLGQSDWNSQSAIWDWEREKLWLPGHKNTLRFKLNISLFRVGVPLQVYFAYRNQSWLAGRNCRAADVISGGLVIPARFW